LDKSIFTKKYYSVIEKNETMPSAQNGWKLIILSETNQTQRCSLLHVEAKNVHLNVE
jgi:hypothetical protein